MALITLNRNGQTFNLSEDNMIYIIAEGTGSKVTFILKDGGVRQTLEFDETPAAIETLADRVYPLDVTAAASKDLYISASRVVNLEGGASSVLEYDAAGATSDILTSVDAEATVLAELNALL